MIMEPMTDLSFDPRTHSAWADEDFLVVGGHVDEITRRKIFCSEYIDFGRLLAHDRVVAEEDHRLEMIQRDGHVYWVPASDKESNGINSFGRWEQAFRIYSNIFTQKYPEKSSELIQYNHVIHTASLTYQWENVDAYDCDFRMHIARHPYRSWGIILQQAWALRLRDKIVRNNYQDNYGRNNGDSRGRRDLCWRYNRGRCTYGASCKSEHKCSICLKFGHGSYNCRRANEQNRSHDRTNDRGADYRRMTETDEMTGKATMHPRNNLIE